MFELENSQQKRIVALSSAILVFMLYSLYNLSLELFNGWQFLGFAHNPKVSLQIITYILVCAVVVHLAARSFIDHRELKHRSIHDGSTGLGNEKKLIADLEAEKKAGNIETKATLFKVYIDGFKAISDSLGQEQSQALVNEFKMRLLGVVYGNLSLYRLSENKFGILVPKLGDAELIRNLGDDIISKISPNFSVDGEEIYLSVSIGAHTFSNIEMNTSSILEKSEFALQQAQNTNGNSFVVYDVDSAQDVRAQFSLDGDLRKMIDSEEIQLVYQPLIDADTGTMRGVEVLSRWKHETQGFISPALFINSAEKMGMLNKLSGQILFRACKTFAKVSDFKVAVNISPLHFTEIGFVEEVIEILSLTDFPAERLEIEITENVLLGDGQQVVLQMRRLRQLGISIALDDFGVGFSGLSYLNKFKVDRIKIDASFIRELETSASCRSMVGTIINLGHDQGFDVTVEGVETVEQVEFLSGFKNICIQGFLFSKPLNLQDLLASPYLISENQANENGDESRYSLFQEAG